jgi:DNA modification methylase
MTYHKVIIGDSRDMRELTDESVHLVVTSPPYWQLKDYGNGNQIGYNDTYEEYINNLNLVWRQCHRVLHKGCRLCVNIGDQFARSVYYGRYKVIPIRTEIIKFCEAIGFDYMGAVIWQKVTTCNTTGGATIMGSFPYPRNGILKLDYEFILIFKKYGTSPNVAPDVKEKSRLTTDEWNQYFAGHWQFPGERQDAHLAMFPVELPRRLIRMFSFVGDTVLDPFLGSGTTTAAAMEVARHSLGYEINREFLPIIERKLGLDQLHAFNNAKVEIIRQTDVKRDYAREIESLPYVFRDPVKFDRKTDPKRLRFGSKIDGEAGGDRREYYSVKTVLSPELLILENGLKVRLLGIKEIPESRDEAIKFIVAKTRGQKVYITFDDIKHDGDGNMYGYLYLKNKTFINAHLIRSGLTGVDDSIEYKYKSRFLKYAHIYNSGGVAAAKR